MVDKDTNASPDQAEEDVKHSRVLLKFKVLEERYVGYHQGPEFAVTPGGAAIQKPEVKGVLQYAVDVEAICANLLNAPCTRMTVTAICHCSSNIKIPPYMIQKLLNIY